MSLAKYREELSQEIAKEDLDYFKIQDLLYKIAVLSDENEQISIMSNLMERSKIQKICLERELKRSRDEDTYLGLEDIADVIKKVLEPEDIKLLKYKL
ncbi:MAG: hypothetical protein BWX56_01286 [Euryarchaeota archaeon ADurb.Bin023]|jgi:hypothetical protein|nr:MAG: hypothetical protein BWX56_01286 [Euryarchaeota archaeon ADurb.Bin023]